MFVRRYPVLIGALAVLLAVLAGSCGSSTRPLARYSSGAGGHGDGRMVQHSAFLTMRVKDDRALQTGLGQVAVQHGGYVVSQSRERSVIRVRQGALDSALVTVEQLGTVTDRTMRGEDVTEAYVDLDARLENARKMRERYRQLLERSEDVASVLAVEKELERIEGEIAAMEAKHTRMQELVSLATITVSVKHKEQLGPLGYVVVYTWKGVRWLFVRH